MDWIEALRASGPEPDYFDSDPLVWAKRVAAVWLDCVTCHGTGRVFARCADGYEQGLCEGHPDEDRHAECDKPCPNCKGEKRRLVASDELREQYGQWRCRLHDLESLCRQWKDRDDLSAPDDTIRASFHRRCGRRLVIPIGDDDA